MSQINSPGGSGGGGGGAPTNATYVTLTTSSGLTNERTLAVQSGALTLTDDGAGNPVIIGAGVNFPLFSVTPVISGPYTATGGSTTTIFTIYNTSGSGFTFNMPATPGINQVAIVVDAGLTAGSHAITIQGNGNTICAYGTTGSSVQLNSNGAAISLAYDGTQWTAYA